MAAAGNSTEERLASLEADVRKISDIESRLQAMETQMATVQQRTAKTTLVPGSNGAGTNGANGVPPVAGTYDGTKF